MSQLQQSKLTNQRLEDEKAELLNEIRKLKGHSLADEFVSLCNQISLRTYYAGFKLSVLYSFFFMQHKTLVIFVCTLVIV